MAPEQLPDHHELPSDRPGTFLVFSSLFFDDFDKSKTFSSVVKPLSVLPYGSGTLQT